MLTKKQSLLLLAGILLFFPLFTKGETSPDRLIIYDMKDDPTLTGFVNDTVAKGFYGLEIDEDLERAAILYRNKEVIYRIDVDVNIKGNQIVLRNKKKKKILIREKIGTQEVVYPSECKPDQTGWRYGVSFGKHSVRKNDEMTRRLVVSTAHLQYESMMARCEGPLGDCGNLGCEEWINASTKTATNVVVSTSPHPAPTPSAVLFSTAMISGQFGSQEIYSKYKREIDQVLPVKVKDLTAATSSYHTTSMPYPQAPDSSNNPPMGVLSKEYLPDDQSALVLIEVQPLPSDYQAPSTKKCGAWEPGPNKTIFDYRGHAALYTQTPATGNTKEVAVLLVCGQTISISVQSKAYRTQEYMKGIVDYLSFEQIEHLVGGKY